MAIIHLKACPRCRGDLQEREDEYGPYLACWQCGYHKELIVYPPLKKRQTLVQGAGEYLPHLPEKPSNYKPWREKERLAWEKEDDIPTM